ncbi:DUF4493 domain-containing protein [Bacteroides caecigallinarum]|uniref:DUF4493 domain-containing protein n=1 Tax=Bacteroides caecigallinarum TaxID=1411144 RepID=UPI00195BF9A6|nr:DUF4493 domain-containing protein [Bacteroides caecigallinarum]MBM6888743.1 DUF4493 domain-containing protein [Bacteroides caecigallinarum]
MNRIEKKVAKVLLYVFSGVFLYSCSSDEAELQFSEGTGYVSLNLNTNIGFQSRAVNESDYQNLSNYTVQILKDGNSLHKWDYNDIPEFTELANNTYTMLAICGDSTKAVYTDDLCVLGSKSFTVKNDSVNVNVTCKPNSARINIEFDEKMDEYFSDYEVRIKTAAQGGSTYIWDNTTAGPVYFKVKQNEVVTMTIKLTPKSGVEADTEIQKTYTLSPADAMKMTLAPVIGSGSLSITITIDETVIEHPVDIEVPSEWV